jgi:uncharacterized protein YggE
MQTEAQRFIKTVALIVVAAGLSTLAVVLVTRLAGGPSLAINQITTNKASTFDVTGESKISTVPDQAEVRMGITINQSTVAAAQDDANRVINDINTQLNSLGIEKKDIKTENYSLYPNMDFQSGTQRITGYTVNANLVVTMTDFAKLNQAIDLATQAGANQIGGITFSLSDDKKAETETEARKEAIENAKEKANELARLSGMNLGKIVNVYESPTPEFMPYAARDMMAQEMAIGSGGGAPTNVEPGSTNFSYSVTLSYETF